MKILILCTGNSCRSQMAEGFLKSYNNLLNVYSAGTKPEKEVNKYAIRVMEELNIDISMNKPETVDVYSQLDFDFVFTVCDNAKNSCPVFIGNVKQKIHIGFEDPADAKGTDDEKLIIYRKIRDQINKEFKEFYINKIEPNL